jgi:hypothetical protein
MRLTTTSTVLVAKEQVTTNLGDEIIILGFKSGNYYGLDAVGSLIWEKIQQPVTVEAIVRAITKEYSVTQDEALADTIELLERLNAEGLIDVQANL